jgi:hypothetical protein
MLRVELSRVDLDPSRPLRRVAPRPPQHRQADYDKNFDFLTVFYDCFASVDDRARILIGPPLANLEPAVVAAIRRSFHRWTRALPSVRNLDHQSTLCVQSRKAKARLQSGVFLQDKIIVQPNACALFRGSKVLLTKSKNNDLVWIRDWVHFFARHHGADAVLLYHNGEAADVPAIHRAVASVQGISVAQIVHWPYLWGPVGWPMNMWDSDFCQYGALEHARHRFLALAAAVVNADIDEFVITRDHQPLFDLVQRSRPGYLRYDGHWVENATSVDGEEPRRHRHYVYRSVAPPELQVQPKWAVVPSRCPSDSQWLVHAISGMEPDSALSNWASIRHFKAINSNWKMPRWRPERPDARKHVVDEGLLPWLKVFQGSDA